MQRKRFWPLVAITVLMASLLLLIVLKWREPQTRLNRKDFPLMISAGVIGVTAYFYFENN